MTRASYKHKTLSFLREGLVFSLLLWVVYIANSVFTNFELFAMEFEELLGADQKTIQTLSDLTPESEWNNITSFFQEQQRIEDNVDALILHAENNGNIVFQEETLEDALYQDLSSFDIAFNVLPPTNRLQIPKIGIDAPLLEWDKTDDELRRGDFEEELENGVVRYPTTGLPGEWWNVFFFGHTSFNFWEKNPYATIFSKIPELEVGDEIEVIWNARKYTYRVIDYMIKSPRKVQDIYMQYQEGKYLTLMGCYPLGKTTNRYLVIAELVE